MNVIFIVPAPVFKRNPIYRLGGKLYGHSNPIVGPMILGAIAKRAGHHVECYQELHGPVDYRRLLKVADIVCLYTMTATAKRAYEIGDMFHEQGHARVMIGGIHASAMPEEAIKHADQVIVGEGESVFLDCIEGRISDPIVKAKPVCNLDELPFPDYSILKTPCECANIVTTRGCPYCCAFCTTSRMFHPYRERSVDDVMNEIRYVYDLGFKYMNFEDDNFTANKERAKEICRRMIDEGLTFKETFFFGRTDMANDEELLDLLSRAHLNRVLIGIESLNQEALDSINKGNKVDDIRRAGEACRRHGIRLIASIVLGIDADSHADIRRSYEFARDIGAYQIQPAILTPLPGTPVYKGLVDEGRMITDNWDLFDMVNVTFQPKKMSPWELQECMFEAIECVYNLRGAMDIWRTFGPEYGLRRIYLAFVSHAGPMLAEWVADNVPVSVYYKLKHTPWMYAKENGVEETVSQPKGPEKHNCGLLGPNMVKNLAVIVGSVLAVAGLAKLGRRAPA
ncbi:MAG: radical SAM protein [Coriobacteriaceae bacterium]|nr:MAG: radical SAM protein [Coriobacteriaceae bacterium]